MARLLGSENLLGAKFSPAEGVSSAHSAVNYRSGFILQKQMLRAGAGEEWRVTRLLVMWPVTGVRKRKQEQSECTRFQDVSATVAQAQLEDGTYRSTSDERNILLGRKRD